MKFYLLFEKYFMKKNEELVEVLNDLIKINNDRIVGYQKASDETDKIDIDLRTVFQEMASQSREYMQQLTQEVKNLGGDVSKGTTMPGKLYRVWMDLKANFTGSDRETILSSCEFGEDAAQKAYDTNAATKAITAIEAEQNRRAAVATAVGIANGYTAAEIANARALLNTTNDAGDNGNGTAFTNPASAKAARDLYRAAIEAAEGAVATAITAINAAANAAAATAVPPRPRWSPAPPRRRIHPPPEQRDSPHPGILRSNPWHALCQASKVASLIF